MNLNFFDGRQTGGGVSAAVLAVALIHGSCLAAEPRVLVLNESNAPPFSNAQRTGFYDVVVGEAFRRAGLGLRIATPPVERALLLSDSGAADGELNRNSAVEKQFANLVRVPEALGEMRFVAFSRDRSIPGNFEALRERRTGYVRGWKIYEQALAGRQNVVAANDAAQLFRLLLLGRIDVALYERDMGGAYLKAQAISAVHVLAPALFIRDQFIYLHKRHAALAAPVADALRAMKRDGTYQRAYRERLLPHIDEGAR